MNARKILLLTLFTALVASWAAHEAYSASVKMRVVVVNPSDKKEQTKSVRTELPKEVKQKDILDAGGLDIEYDTEKGAFYASKNDIPLAPLETKIFEIVMNDVWIWPKENLDFFREQTKKIVAKLKDTSFGEQAELIAKTIYGRLDEIETNQNDQNVSRQQHVAYFREANKTIESVKADIERLQKLLITAGGTPNLDLVENADVKLKSPNTKTTWIVIFAVILFVAILSGTFYFTWLRQSSNSDAVFKKEKDASFAEFKPKKE